MAEAESLEPMHEEKLDEFPRDELDDDEEEKKSQLSESQQYVEFTHPESESLSTVVVLPENGQCAGVQASLATESLQGAELKTLPTVIASGSELQVETDHQTFTCPNRISELSPTSVTQSISAHTQPSPEHKTTILKIDDFCSPKDNKQKSSYIKSSLVVKTPTPDGYNWRKYGQKQVKSPIGSRSYYKCTRSDCSAKKIECSDHSGNLVEIVKRGTHTHDAPKRNDCTKEYYPSSAHALENSVTVTEHLIATPSALAASTSFKHYIPVELAGSVSERKRPASSGSEGTGESQQVKEALNEPEPKRRLKKSDSMCSESIHKSEKKPKHVVHAAGDVGISDDGYRWRKYGQKMVKGNPHPRNYYRCTSAGCPVRKHIETAVDNASAVIVTYKGVHDHDTPVPKKRHGPQSGPLVAAAPTSVTNTQVNKIDSPQNQKTSSTQWSVGSEGELTGQTLDVVGGEKKTIESARTLLSIGFEIKPC